MLAIYRKVITVHISNNLCHRQWDVILGGIIQTGNMAVSGTGDNAAELHMASFYCTKHMFVNIICSGAKQSIHVRLAGVPELYSDFVATFCRLTGGAGRLRDILWMNR